VVDCKKSEPTATDASRVMRVFVDPTTHQIIPQFDQAGTYLASVPSFLVEQEGNKKETA